MRPRGQTPRMPGASVPTPASGSWSFNEAAGADPADAAVAEIRKADERSELQ